jgi:site-specific recombinase XerD
MQHGLIDKFKRELEIRNFSKKTVKSYMFAVERFIRFSENKGLNENTVKNYIQILLRKQNP